MDNSEGTNISFYLNDLCQTVRMACAVNILIYNGYHFPFSLYQFLNDLFFYDDVYIKVNNYDFRDEIYQIKVNEFSC